MDGVSLVEVTTFIQSLLVAGWGMFLSVVVHGSMDYHLRSHPTQYLPQQLHFSLPLFLSFYLSFVGVLSPPLLGIFKAPTLI